MNILEQLIHSQDVVLADGATGTNLFAKGLETGDAPELWNLSQPDKISDLHNEFIAAGSDIILTNSFGGTQYRLALHNAQDKVISVNKAAARLARQAADQAQRTIIVAGCMGPTGELFAPLGALDEASARAAFATQAQALAEGGADILWIETMSSVEEVRAAIDAAKTTALPVFATMTFDTAARTMMGITPAEFATLAQELEISACGANCGIGPSELLDSLFGMKEAGLAGDMPLMIAKGNCGIPSYVDGEIHYAGTPDLMADYAKMSYLMGARIIGGCCGTTPAHIKAMRSALDEVRKDPAPSPSREAVSALLGTPWANVPTPPSGTTSQRPRRRRRS